MNDGTILVIFIESGKHAGLKRNIFIDPTNVCLPCYTCLSKRKFTSGENIASTKKLIGFILRFTLNEFDINTKGEEDIYTK